MSNLGESLGNMATESQQIMAGIAGMNIDLTSTAGTFPDVDKVDWYRSRFKMFKQDGCMDAINSYLLKSTRDDCNEITKVYIMKAALEVMSGE